MVSESLLRNVKQDLKEFPCYKIENGRLVQIPTPPCWMWVHLHHYIRTGWISRNPDKWAQVKHLQKLIYLDPVMHSELHNKHSKFKEKYGIEIQELLFDWRTYMLDAKTARQKSQTNGVKLRLEHVERQIQKAIDKGNTDTFIYGTVDKQVLEELEKHNYSYDIQQTGLKIMW